MSSTRSIKQRIENVRSVAQIIRAMDMVASTKLVRARSQLEGVRPIYSELKRISKEVGALEEAMSSKFYEKREVKNSLYIVITGNRGLAGGYNSNICKKALEHMKQGENDKLAIVGSKGYEYFQKKGKNIVHSIVDMSDDNVYYGSENIAQKAIELYLAGEVEEVFVAYTRFVNVLTNEPVVEKLLPIESDTTEYSGIEMKYEPDLESFIDNLIPLYLHMSFLRAFSESHTSEHASRMVNMDAAGKNASEKLEDLNRQYNRMRQQSITQELTEIVGSVSVLSNGGADEG